MGNASDPGDPRKENFCKFLQNFCCPMFVFTSVIFFVSIVDVIMYCVSLGFGIQRSPTELLAPKFDTLNMLGMKVNKYIISYQNPYLMQRGQVWRFITFAFLHANFVHIVVNLFSQIIIGSFMEHAIGSLRIGCLYLFTA